MERKCNKCEELKPLDAFYRRKTGAYDTYCRSCKNKQNVKRSKERYNSDPAFKEYVDLKNREHSKRRTSVRKENQELKQKLETLKNLGDPTLWGGREIEIFREVFEW